MSHGGTGWRKLAGSPLLRVLAVMAPIYAVQSGARVSSALQALALDASTFTVGAALALYAVFPALMSLRLGRWIDARGVRLPLIAGSTLAGAGCVLAGLGVGVPGLLVASALIGTGYSTVNIAAMHAIGQISTPLTRASNFNRMSLAVSATSFIGPVLAGALIDRLGHGATFLAFACVALLACWLALSHAAQGGAQPKATAAAAAARVAHRSAWRLLVDRRLQPIYWTGVLVAAAWDLFTLFVPVQGTRMGLSASSVGLILGTFAIASLLVRIVMHWLLETTSEWAVLSAAMAVCGLCFVLLPLARDAVALSAIAFALGLALGATQANILSLLHQGAPAGRGAEALGMRLTIGHGAQALLPAAFGSLGAAIGLLPVFWAVALATALSLPMMWRQRGLTAEAPRDA